MFNRIKCYLLSWNKIFFNNFWKKNLNLRIKDNKNKTCFWIKKATKY